MTDIRYRWTVTADFYYLSSAWWRWGVLWCLDLPEEELEFI